MGEVSKAKGVGVSESEKLEAEAIALYRENKFFLSMNAKAKKFFRNVAEFNGWEKLKKEL